MERMFPEPKEFIKIPTWVIKDNASPYDRYVCINKEKYTGLLEATKFTKEELEKRSLKENEVAIEYDKLILPVKKSI